MSVVDFSSDWNVRVFADITTRAWESSLESLESSSQTFFLFEAAELSELESSELDPDSDDDEATPAQKRDMVDI